MEQYAAREGKSQAFCYSRFSKFFDLTLDDFLGNLM